MGVALWTDVGDEVAPDRGIELELHEVEGLGVPVVGDKGQDLERG